MDDLTGTSHRKEAFTHLLRRVETILEDDVSRDDRLGAVCSLLREEVPHYDWVGFYLVDPGGKDELVLGPYDGEPTEHTRIPFGSGICGQAASRRETFVVQDVSGETNYLSCSANVRSEVVVPIMREGEVLGELDIDSHRLSPFTDEDREFLERVCLLVLEIL
jgi:GAF domain-containing protein